MKTRNIFILLIVLIAVATSLVTLNKQEKTNEKTTSLLESSIIEKLDGLELYEANTLKLSGKLKDQVWKIENTHNLPLNFSMFFQLIETLKSTKVLRSFEANEKRIESLKLGKEKIIFKSGDKSLIEILIGKNAQNGGTFVKLSDQTKVLLIDAMIDLETNPQAWQSKQALSDFSTSQIQSFKLTIADETCSLKREKTDHSFTIQGNNKTKELDLAMVTGLINELLGIRYIGTIDIHSNSVIKAMENAKTFELTDFEDKQVKIQIAAKTEDLNKNEDLEKKAVKTAYLSLDFSPENPKWSECSNNFAFEISDYVFQKLPQSIENIFVQVPVTKENSIDTEGISK